MSQHNMKELSPYFDTLLFFGSQLADGGTYTCKVSNVAGQVDRTFRLTVHGENPSALFSNTLHIYFKKDVISFFDLISSVPPVLDGSLRESLNYTLGSHVTLLCEASGVPMPSITWLKDGTPIGETEAMMG